MDVRFGLWRKLSTEELMLLNYGVGEDSWESLGLQGDPTSPSWRKSVLNICWKDWCWSWNSNTLATWCKNWLTGKEPDTGKDWRQEEKGMTEDEMVGWHHLLDGHDFEQAPGVVMSRWWTGKPDVLQSMRSQRVDWVTELNWTHLANWGHPKYMKQKWNWRKSKKFYKTFGDV